MEQKYILFHIDLQSGIFCENDLLGKKFEAQIRSLKGFLEFPHVDEDFRSNYNKYLFSPYFYDNFKNKPSDLNWGFIRGYNTKNSDILEVIVTRLILYFQCNDIEDSKKIGEHKDAITTWIDLFKECLKVVGKTTLYNPGNFDNSHISIFFPQEEREVLNEFWSKSNLDDPIIWNLRDLYPPLSEPVLEKILFLCKRLPFKRDPFYHNFKFTRFIRMCIY